jgi:hypothetical protein
MWIDCKLVWIAIEYFFDTASARFEFLYSPVYFLASQDLCFAVLPFPC